MNKPNNAVGILGIGSCVPDKVLSNGELEKMVDTSDDWITKRTGISERRILESDRPAYELGIEAAKKALEDAGLKAEELDLIIAATETPDYLTPSTACSIQNGIEAWNAAAFDINAACSGFIYGLVAAQQFVMTGTCKHVLVIGCEGLSKVVDWTDRNTCVLFGDGAGAAVVGPVEEGYGIISSHIGSDGSAGRNITIPCCYSNDEDREKRSGKDRLTVWMEGSEVFKFAVKIMEQATLKVLEQSGTSLDDINLIIPHQANIRIIDGAAKRLGMPDDKVFANVRLFGNISSASIPVALSEAVKTGAVHKGDNIVLVGFGGGLTWGSMLLKWSK